MKTQFLPRQRGVSLEALRSVGARLMTPRAARCVAWWVIRSELMQSLSSALHWLGGILDMRHFTVILAVLVTVAVVALLPRQRGVSLEALRSRCARLVTPRAVRWIFREILWPELSQNLGSALHWLAWMLSMHPLLVVAAVIVAVAVVALLLRQRGVSLEALRSGCARLVTPRAVRWIFREILKPMLMQSLGSDPYWRAIAGLL
jgi:multisubunit Na+/H+ antiporter MnhE subunit